MLARPGGGAGSVPGTRAGSRPNSSAIISAQSSSLTSRRAKRYRGEKGPGHGHGDTHCSGLLHLPGVWPGPGRGCAVWLVAVAASSWLGGVILTLGKWAFYIHSGAIINLPSE